MTVPTGRSYFKVAKFQITIQLIFSLRESGLCKNLKWFARDRKRLHALMSQRNIDVHPCALRQEARTRSVCLISRCAARTPDTFVKFNAFLAERHEKGSIFPRTAMGKQTPRHSKHKSIVTLLLQKNKLFFWCYLTLNTFASPINHKRILFEAWSLELWQKGNTCLRFRVWTWQRTYV